MTDDEMLQYITDSFEENYELLQLEGGHSLAPFVKKMALEQVKLYWKKLKDVAENVAETEVKLTLPLQETACGRKYTIQGVVDVVREDEGTILYDIKTHDVDYVRDNKEDYVGQLNIYAHIWQTIRGQKLDGTSIVATGQTEDIKRAIHSRDSRRLEKAIEEWEPEVQIEINPEKLDGTISSFGEVVDLIEENKFAPPNINRLNAVVQKNQIFAVHVCRNCDIRFSCVSYKEYSFSSTRAKSDFMYYYEDYGTEHERIEALDSNLEIIEEV